MRALSKLLKADPDEIDSLSIQQIVALCGNGKLTDNSECSRDLLDYLRIAKSENLSRYLQACLHEAFDKSGFVLQDIINEFGRRLDYLVENGLYQGKSSAVGFDGIWLVSGGHAIVVEVKTTDAYRINLDTIAGYRDDLIAGGKVDKHSSILIVVGRQDTGDLEAQVRGSQHAWTVRIVSADALAKLVAMKENAEAASAVKIHELLVPFEYTRLDKIIDIAFTVTEDTASALEEEQALEAEPIPFTAQDAFGGTSKQKRTSREVLAEARAEILTALSRKFGPLVKKSRALYWTADKSARAAVTLSKQYEEGNYWYAYHPDWDEFLGAADQGLFVLGCVGRGEAFAIPYAWVHSRVQFLNRSKEGSHWHIYIYPMNDGQLALRLNNGQNESLVNFKMPLGGGISGK